MTGAALVADGGHGDPPVSEAPRLTLGVDTLCWHLRLEAGDLSLEDLLEEAVQAEAEYVQLTLHHARGRTPAELERLAGRAARPRDARAGVRRFPGRGPLRRSSGSRGRAGGRLARARRGAREPDPARDLQLLPGRSGRHSRGDRGRAALGDRGASGRAARRAGGRRDAGAREPLRLHGRRVPLHPRGGGRRAGGDVPRRDQPGRGPRGSRAGGGAARALRRGRSREGLRARVDPQRRRLPPPRLLGALPLPGRGRGGSARHLVRAGGGPREAGSCRWRWRASTTEETFATRSSACAARCGACASSFPPPPGREQRIRAGGECRPRVGGGRHPRGPGLPPWWASFAPCSSSRRRGCSCSPCSRCCWARTCR